MNSDTTRRRQKTQHNASKNLVRKNRVFIFSGISYTNNISDGGTGMLTKVKITKAEKYAIREQALSASVREFFMKSFGCVRKVKNLYTDYLYKELESFGCSGGSELPSIKLPEVTYWKKQYPYLKEVDSLALANAKIDFESAVKNYNEEHDHVTYTKRAKRRADAGTEPLSFRGLKGMPKFHSKRKGHFSYKTNCQNSSGKDTITLTGNKLHLPKLKEDIELVMHRSFPERLCHNK